MPDDQLILALQALIASLDPPVTSKQADALVELREILVRMRQRAAPSPPSRITATAQPHHRPYE